MRRRLMSAIVVLVGAASMAADARASAVYFVNSTADTVSSGCAGVQDDQLPSTDPDEVAATTCTLREAIALSNAVPGPGDPDTILFNVGGPFRVGSPLPALRGGIYVEAQFNDVAVDLVGGAAGEGAGFPGLVLEGSGNILGGFGVYGFTDGVVLAGSGAHNVQGVRSGLSITEGPATVRNTGSGLRIRAGSTHNLVGEVDYIRPAVLSGNDGWGIAVEDGAGQNDIRAAVVGPASYGYATDPNGAGGILVESSANDIGDTTPCTDGSPAAFCSSVTVSGNDGPGIVLAAGSSGTRIVNTWVGIDYLGTGVAPNQGDGIVAGGDGDVIGRAVASGMVVVAGNTGRGIVLRGTDATVRNTRIGLDDDAPVAWPNGAGGILASSATVADGGHTIAQNVIAGNSGPGIELQQAGSTVRGNTIGTDVDRSVALPNSGDGIRVSRGPQTIGGVGSAQNVIANSGGAGVAIVSELPGVVPRGVHLQFDNVFVDNAGLGIDLGGDGRTADDDRDGDDGPNGLQNAGRLLSVSSSGGTNGFRGTLSSTPNTTFEIGLYRASTCDPSGAGEADAFFGGGFATTGADGTAFFGFESTGTQYAVGDSVTIVVTAPDGSSSEFSPCFTTTEGVDVSVTQRVSDAAVVAGREFELVATVRNAGPATATGVELTQSLPSGTAIVASPAGCEAPANGTRRCAIEDLAPGAGAERRFLLRPVVSGSVTSRLAVGAREVDTNLADNTSDLDLTVAPDPALLPPGPAPGTNLNLPRPVFAELLRIAPVTGSVTATLPGGRPFVLSSFALVPVGTEVDAGKGIAQVTAGLPDGSTASGTFRDAAFRLRQPAAENGMTEARITTPLACAGAAQAATTTTTRATTAATKRPAKRKKARRYLWGNVKGKFRIRGKHAVGAVRGTKWRVLDTCTSTEVFVRQGVVAASPLNDARPGQRILRAGQRVTFRRP